MARSGSVMPSKLSQPWRVPRNISTWDDARLICEAMRKHSENEKVALGGCRALHRCGLSTADAISTVVSAMRAHSSEKLQRTAVARSPRPLHNARTWYQMPVACRPL